MSIVTPVLNRASTILACLFSVSAQTYPAVEHIVIDGGSTDGTLEAISNFRSHHRLRWVSERDDGMYEAINKGLRMARGAIYAYVNSDDLYLPWSIEAAVSQLSKGSDLVYGDMALLTRGRNTLRPKFYRPFDLNYYTHFAAIGQPTVFWRARVTNRIGPFDTSYQLIGDCDYWLRAAVAGFALTHIDEILAIQVEHGGTLRRTRPQQLECEQHRMRSAYEAVAGPPARRAFRSRREGLRWRRLQIQFILAAHRSNPAKWSRFIGFLREQSIDVSGNGLMWYLLPSRLWPRDLSTVDAELFEERLTAATRVRPT